MRGRPGRNAARRPPPLPSSHHHRHRNSFAVRLRSPQHPVVAPAATSASSPASLWGRPSAGAGLRPRPLTALDTDLIGVIRSGQQAVGAPPAVRMAFPPGIPEMDNRDDGRLDLNAELLAVIRGGGQGKVLPPSSGEHFRTSLHSSDVNSGPADVASRPSSNPAPLPSLTGRHDASAAGLTAETRCRGSGMVRPLVTGVHSSGGSRPAPLHDSAGLRDSGLQHGIGPPSIPAPQQLSAGLRSPRLMKDNDITDLGSPPCKIDAPKSATKKTELIHQGKFTRNKPAYPPTAPVKALHNSAFADKAKINLMFKALVAARIGPGSVSEPPASSGGTDYVKEVNGESNQRLEDRYVLEPSAYSNLVEILRKEMSEGTTRKADSCSRAILWLTRSIDFGVALMERLDKDSELSLEQVVEDAYVNTLKPWHGWISTAAYRIAVKLIPERKIFTSLLMCKGQDSKTLKEDIYNLMSLLQPSMNEIHVHLKEFRLDRLRST